MNRRGFALIAVLWVTAALGMLTTVGLAEVEVARIAAENRLLHRRAHWAARACLAVLQARQREGEALRSLEPTALGPELACEAYWRDPHERLHPAHADSTALVRVLRDVVAAASLLDWMDPDDVARGAGAEAAWYRAHGRLPPGNGTPASTRELLLVRGFEGRTRAWVDRVFTVDGDGRIDPNRAPREVLESLSMLSRQEAARVVPLRRGRRLEDAEEVMNAAGARMSAPAFRALSARLVFDASDHQARVVGQASRGTQVLTVTLDARLRREDARWTVLELRANP